MAQIFGLVVADCTSVQSLELVVDANMTTPPQHPIRESSVSIALALRVVTSWVVNGVAGRVRLRVEH